MNTPPDESPDVAALAALGFGPEASLMTEPKLFLDSRLLSALIVELEDELGYPGAARTLFLIGLTHGLRDADRAVAQGFLASSATAAAPGSTPPGTVYPSLRMDLAAPTGGPDGHHLCGSWPDRFEANAWLGRFGPSDTPSCWLSSGYASGWLSGTLDSDILALEDSCSGAGDACCRFNAREVASWQGCDDHALRDLLGEIDFELFRSLALRSPGGTTPELIESEGDFDPEAPLVHIWGPVMILPFTTGDELLRTTEALSLDPATGDIAAVVLDLRGALVDEAFGAAAIERTLATIEAWEAEPILTGVAPLTEPVIRGLETDHLLIRKDLEEAIATAFLISEAQRHAA